MTAGESPRRVVALGASNLTRGFLTLVETVRLVHGDPLEIVAALGHGRSYGMSSFVLGRRLPGILDCGFWEQLDRLGPAPTRAIVSDVGNDILYGASAGQILDWIEQALQRLRRRGAEIVMTDLPPASLQRLSEGRFLLFRTIFVPSCRLSLETVRNRSREVNAGLERLAQAHGATFIRLRPEWYGFDPIHIRPRHWREAWQEIALGGRAAPANPGRASLRQWLRLYLARPERRWMFGIEQRRAQPAVRLPGGTSVFLF